MDVSTSILDKVFAQQQTDLSGRAAVDSEFAEEYPFLFELLTAMPTANGKTRTVCTITLVAEDGVWKAGLRDRDHNMSLWVSATAFKELWDALEAALHASPVPWRRINETYGQTRNRK